MPFSETIKLVVKRKAHFMCCLCHSLGVEVHHIIPEALSGADSEDNAVPLCPSCHETYGANPEKRKFIREARELWYEICERRYVSDPDRLDQISTLLSATASRADIEHAVKQITSAIESAALKPHTHGQDEPPLHASWDEDGLREYLRWLYPDVTHCGIQGLRKLLADLNQIGYKSLTELHRVVGDTGEGFKTFAASWRNQGGNVDSGTDTYPIRLFLAVFDEEYCRVHYPASFAKRGPTFWRRPSRNVAV